jgi:hypothetical protein
MKANSEVLMRKSSTAQVVTTINVNLKRSAKSDLATFRSFVSDLKKDPVKLRAVAIRAGISTPAGRLKKAYAG